MQGERFGKVRFMLKAEVDQVPVLTEAMLRRLDRPGPRYTSYPTADRFVEAFGPAEYRQALAQRAEGATVGGKPPLSLYIHIPFCESVCYYCACNKVITKHHDKAAEYLEVLAQEVALNVAVLGKGQTVSQLHLGGGTPTFLSDDELTRLMQMLRASFKVTAGAEISIEVDPRTASPDRLRHMAALGFNRLSFGVQDFDADVQKAVHRVQPFESVRDLMLAAREIDILFANENELAAMTGTVDFDAGLAAIAPQVPVLVVTRGEHGAVCVTGGERTAVAAAPVTKVVDTTGAGDLFAAGFLFGHVRGRNVAACLTLGAICAAEIISHYGARPEADLQALVAETVG